MNSIIILLLAFIIFLILREFVCWYFKLTEITIILKRIDESLNTNEKIRKEVLKSAN